MREALFDFSDSAATALGSERSARLGDLARRVTQLADLTADASTVEVLLHRLDRDGVRRLERSARPNEGWVCAENVDGTFLAVDEVSDAGKSDPAAALTYPSIHTQLVSWWLFHAWRSTDLAEDTIRSLGSWRIASAAVTARALIEEAGCLVQESNKIARAWELAKAAPEHPVVERPSRVRLTMHPVLMQATFGTRIKDLPKAPQATSVQTYVDKLAKATAEPRINTWYDWLTDAAHPALAARLAYAAPPLVSPAHAVTLRYYARSPIMEMSSRGVNQLPHEIANYVADASLAAGVVICNILEQVLYVVDDFGLTTGAARLTDRTYWRNFTPIRGSRACPCGRGPWSQCRHRWGYPAPVVTTQAISDTL